MTHDVKNLLIDFGGVLIDLDRERCIRHFRALGIEGVESLLDMYHQQDFLMLHEKGLISSAQFRDAVRERAASPTLADAEIDDAWNSFLAGIPAARLELLMRLRRDYRTFLLSNTNAIHWEWACRHAFPHNGWQAADYFERIYLSFEMKLAKPDPAIFRAVLDDAGIQAGETLFIDDAAENCRVAAGLGLATYTPKAHEDWSHLFG